MKTISITNFEALNIVAWANQLTEEKLSKLDFKIRWALHKATTKISQDVKDFEKFRNGEVMKLQQAFFNDEKSEEYQEMVMGEDGEPQMDDNDNPVYKTMRKVKDEYMTEYQTAINELNRKIEEVLAEKNNYEIATADINGFVDTLEQPDPLTFSDLEMLDALIGDET